MHGADRGLVERVDRFEGASDPDDEAILLGLRCPECGALGTFTSGYGPSADPIIVDQLVMLDTRFRSGSRPAPPDALAQAVAKNRAIQRAHDLAIERPGE